MENVMNFLADNYIWFFVAAGILCFALIGFVIESRKKQKNEFKGESIEESNANNNVVNNSVETPVTPVQPVEPINNTLESASVVEPVMPTPEPVTLESTMEVSEPPIMTEPLDVPQASPIELYNEPVTMETPVEVAPIEPMPSVSETPMMSEMPVMESVVEPMPEVTVAPVVEPVVTATIGDTVSYEETPMETAADSIINSMETPTQTNTIDLNTPLEETLEKKESNDYNIFDNMN